MFGGNRIHSRAFNIRVAMLSTKTLSAFAGMILVATGCGGTNAASVGSPSYGGDVLNNAQREQVVDNATKALNQGAAPKFTAGLNGFGFDLFRKVAAATPKANACVSPVSVSSVLAMLYNGSAGGGPKQNSGARERGQGTPHPAHERG